MFNVSDTAYDNFMGRYSMRLAPLFADFAGVAAGQRVLDVGAGTGALTSELLRRGADVAAADPSPPFVAALRSRLPGVDVRAAPAEELPWPDESFDAALAQLVRHVHGRRAGRRRRDAPRRPARRRRRRLHVGPRRAWRCSPPSIARSRHSPSAARRPRRARSTGRARRSRACSRRRLRRRADRAARGRGGVHGLRRVLGRARGRRGPGGRLGQVARRRPARRGARGAPPAGRRAGGRFTLHGRAWATRATRA